MACEVFVMLHCLNLGGDVLDIQKYFDSVIAACMCDLLRSAAVSTIFSI